MPVTFHLIEGDYPKEFPPGLDEFPTVIDEEHFIDAWMLNSVYNSLLALEQYLLNYKENIEAPLGNDIIGEDGQLLISIPPALYRAYKFAMAWDSDLLEENIKAGVNIFGVVGILAAGLGGVSISLPSLFIVPIITPPALSQDAAIPAISLPTLGVV